MDATVAPEPPALSETTGAALLSCAMALVEDPIEARALVERTIDRARLADAHARPLAEADLFRMLRQAYHSIERSRPRRPMRDALVTSLAVQRDAAAGVDG